jgi:sialate O-acetylesterase
MEVHETLFPLLVDSWREYFSSVIPSEAKESVPFYYVQLSSLNRPSWPIFRDSQRRLMDSRPGLGMAVTSDLGDPTDVHYREKRPVGERLALQALAKHYQWRVTADGPLAQEAVRVDQTVFVDFGPRADLRSSDGGPVTGFEIQDAADGLFHPVDAQVRAGMICLDCTAIREPKAVRYAWQPYTRANLVNAAGLPASTFRLPVH